MTWNIGWSSKAFDFVADNETATLSFVCEQSALQHYAYVDGVHFDELIGVDPNVPSVAPLRLRAFPIPARAVVRLAFDAPAGRSCDLEVFDLHGRRQ